MLIQVSGRLGSPVWQEFWPLWQLPAACQLIRSHDRSTGDEARVQPLTEKRFNSCLGEKVDGHVFRTWKTDRDLFHFPSVLRQTLTGWSSFFHSNSRTIMWISKKGPRAFRGCVGEWWCVVIAITRHKVKMFVFFPDLSHFISIETSQYSQCIP